jgi:hypothetical protein
MGALLRRHAIKADRNGKFDPLEVDRLLEADAGSPTSGEMSLAEAIRRKESALARLRELEFEMRSGRYLITEVVRDQMMRWASMLRSIILTLPSKAVAQMSDDGIKRALYSAALTIRDELLRQLAGVTHSGCDVDLCASCATKVAAAAADYEFPEEAFPKRARQ